ncbi:MAG: DUF3168 domain-containing protein [Alphaproteobacteria bacterium]
MTIFSHFSLQKAIYELLTGDTALMNLITGVHDKVPENAQFPYVMIGDIACADWASKTTSGMECNALLTVYSREGGRRQAMQIMERLYALMHDADMGVDNHTLVMMRFASSAITLESDGETYRGMMRYKVLLQSA